VKIDILREPELEFGDGRRHEDIRFGITEHGPLDCALPTAPKIIRVGVVGTPQSVEGFCGWLLRCQGGIAAKDSRQPNLFPAFPGCGPDVAFRTSVVATSAFCRELPERQIKAVIKETAPADLVRVGADLFLKEFAHLVENTNVDVLICAWPLALLNAMEQGRSVRKALVGDEEDEDSADFELDFHDYLKARGMALRKPIQVVRPATYDESLRKHQKTRPDRMSALQDEATRAWNIHTALYYKAGGTPWRLVRDSSQLDACYVGVSFYKTLDGASLRSGVAQVFNQRGEGVVMRGGRAQLSKEDRQYHLSRDDARRLLDHALDKYREMHHHLPARVALHKSSPYNTDEQEGFAEAIASKGVEYVDMIHVTRTTTRLYRVGGYPPLRGTILFPDDSSAVLYTKGSVDFFETWPGLYVPMPRLLKYVDISKSPMFLADEVLALTKMNWNNTQFDGADPITIRAARQVSSILRYLGDDDPLDPRYSFYM
jgi:hypothetical protein